MSTEHDSRDRAHELIAKMQGRAGERFELELAELRTTMIAMAAYCEQSLTRLRDARWVPLDSVSEVVTDLTAAVDAERSRATHLSEDLEAARRDLENLRAESLTEIQAARDAAVRYREDTAASFTQELNAAREVALSAVQAEAKVRQELKALQARNQEIVDAQMLRLVELKRSLEASSTESEHDRTAADAAREAIAKLSQAPSPSPSATEKAAPAAEVNQKAVPAAEANQKTAGAAEINLEPVPSRHHLAPLFSAIESALADSPPVPAAWEERVGA